MSWARQGQKRRATTLYKELDLECALTSMMRMSSREKRFMEVLK